LSSGFDPDLKKGEIMPSVLGIQLASEEWALG